MCVARGLLALGLWLASACLALADDPADSMTIYRQTVEDFKASRFDRLDETAEDYRTNRPLNLNGAWRLDVFYDALGNAKDLVGASDAAGLDQVEQRLNAWLESDPKSKTAHILLARFAVSRGWLARGDGLAGSVTPEGWRQLRASLRDAYLQLQNARDLIADDPERYAILLLIARTEGAPKPVFDALAAEALDRAPGYARISDEVLLGNLPQWGGSWEAYDRAVDDLVARSSAVSGQAVYARSYWRLSETQLKSRLFAKSLAKWPRMKQGFEDLVAKYPSTRNLNAFGAFACLAMDGPTTVKVIDRLADKIEAPAWDWITSLKACMQYAEQQRNLAEDIAHWNTRQPRPDELKERDAVIARTSADFIAGRFDELDSAYAILLSSKERTSSGDWKLAYFYDGLTPLSMIYPPGSRVGQPVFDQAEEQTRKWLASNPTSSAAAIAEIRLMSFRAGAALGTNRPGGPKGPAPRSAEAYALLAKARARIEAVRDAASSDPQWWAVKLDVIRQDGAPDDELDTVAGEALKRNPDYQGTRQAILMRRWPAFNKGGFDDLVSRMVADVPPELANRTYAQSYLWLASVLRSGDLFQKTLMSWPAMRAGLDETVAQWPTDWNLNAFARLACMAKDKAVSGLLLARIEGRIIEEQWGYWREPAACVELLKKAGD